MTGTTACSWDTIIPFEPLWAAYKRIIKPNGAIVLTASQPFTSMLVMSNIDNYSHQWIWEKEMGSNPLLANKMPMKNFEDVIVFINQYKNYDYDFKHPLREYAKKILNFIGKGLNKINLDLGHRKAEHFFYITSTQFGICTEECYSSLIEMYKIDKLEYFKTYTELLEEDKQYKQSLNIPSRTYNPQKTEGKAYIVKTGKANMPHLKSLENIITINNGDRFPKTILRINTERGSHPTQKPVVLMSYLIKTYTNEGELVLDNCAGSGTTGVAAKQLNRKFILIEKEQKYCDIANERLNQVGLAL